MYIQIRFRNYRIHLNQVIKKKFIFFIHQMKKETYLRKIVTIYVPKVDQVDELKTESWF